MAKHPIAVLSRRGERFPPQLLGALEAGEGVVVHCKGGLGRAGTIAAKLLLAANPHLSPSEAIAQIRSVRHNAIETRVQELYLQGIR